MTIPLSKTVLDGFNAAEKGCHGTITAEHRAAWLLADAAPDLLEALRSITAYLDQSLEDYDPEACKLIEQASAAIAKATGKED